MEQSQFLVTEMTIGQRHHNCRAQKLLGEGRICSESLGQITVLNRGQALPVEFGVGQGGRQVIGQRSALSFAEITVSKSQLVQGRQPDTPNLCALDWRCHRNQREEKEVVKIQP